MARPAPQTNSGATTATNASFNLEFPMPILLRKALVASPCLVSTSII
jgi:hypothetical protein